MKQASGMVGSSGASGVRLSWSHSGFPAWPLSSHGPWIVCLSHLGASLSLSWELLSLCSCHLSRPNVTLMAPNSPAPQGPRGFCQEGR